MIQLEKLFKAGVHFGHLKRSWCPRMEPYIWGHKSGVHLIDISKTAKELEKASKFLKELVGQGHEVLWVGTKKPAQEIIRTVAAKLNMPSVSHRWIGGTLSNFAQVKKSVTKFLHYKDILEKTDKYPHYTKKELNTIQKAAARLEQNVGGIVQLTWPVGALVVVDVIKERSALREASAMGIPVIALVDTNADPSLVDYVIPTNDDAPRAIQVIIDYLAEAAAEGKAVADKLREENKLKRDEARAKAKPGQEYELPDELDSEQPVAKKAGTTRAPKEKEGFSRRPTRRMTSNKKTQE